MIVPLLVVIWEDPTASAWVELAHRAVAAAVRGETLAVRGATPAKGVFVTIERDGTIRGCRGSLSPITRSLEAEIARAAQSAAGFDPRYPRLRASELPLLKVTVTIVDRLVPISTTTGLLPEDGLVVRDGERVGVVLPWEGRDVQVRRTWGYRKAGIPADHPASLFRLVGRRYRG